MRYTSTAQEEVRELRPKPPDATALYGLYAPCYDSTIARLASTRSVGPKGDFRNAPSIGLFVDNQRVAAATLRYHDGFRVAECALICVHPRHGGRGYGRRVAEAAMALARRNHPRTLHRFVLDADANPAAEKFWSKLGFRNQTHPYSPYALYRNTIPMVREAGKKKTRHATAKPARRSADVRRSSTR